MLFFVFNPIKIQNRPQKYVKIIEYARKLQKKVRKNRTF